MAPGLHEVYEGGEEEHNDQQQHEEEGQGLVRFLQDLPEEVELLQPPQQLQEPKERHHAEEDKLYGTVALGRLETHGRAHHDRRRGREVGDVVHTHQEAARVWAHTVPQDQLQPKDHVKHHAIHYDSRNSQVLPKHLGEVRHKADQCRQKHKRRPEPGVPQCSLAGSGLFQEGGDRLHPEAAGLEGSDALQGLHGQPLRATCRTLRSPVGIHQRGGRGQPLRREAGHRLWRPRHGALPSAALLHGLPDGDDASLAAGELRGQLIDPVVHLIKVRVQ
mmetsp:Transcript_89006/g.275538  ORF Transcript_89006/g.275538 Transcript_89006/m.275538 type:complete len:276 (-) Transcript_89006:301-1128(-)